MLSNLVNDFLKEYCSQRKPYLPLVKDSKKIEITTKEELIKILADVELLYRNNKDKTLEELIELIIKDNVLKFENIRKKYGVPGYTVSIKVGNTNVKLYGGNINYLGEPMPSNALFDIASMTKFYTQIIVYNLMKEGLFKRSDKVRELDNRFVNLGNLTVDQILTFSTTFLTDGLIKDKKTIAEAKDTLFHTNVLDTGKWNYNDIGLMIMKELMERLTGLSYIQLVDKYIVKPLGLTDTHIIVPQNKYKLITGTPNYREGLVNDMTANAQGGYSGHAGIFASSDDLIKLMFQIKDILPNSKDVYTPNNYRDSTAKMGNVYIAHPTGIYDSFVDTTEPRDTFAIAGSTRTNAAASKDSAYTVLFNPSSMSVSEARERINKINSETGKNINPVREYEFNRNGKLIKLNLIDPRALFPVDSMATTVKSVAITTIKLRFLDFILKKYEKELETVNVIKKIR